MNEGLERPVGGWGMIRIATQGGGRSVKARMVGEWAIHRGDPKDPFTSNLWAVTHLKSGRKFRGWFPDLPGALDFVRELRRLVAGAGLDIDTEDSVTVTRSLYRRGKSIIDAKRAHGCVRVPGEGDTEGLPLHRRYSNGEW